MPAPAAPSSCARASRGPRNRLAASVAGLLLWATGAALAQPQLPPPEATDPVKRGVMQGFPPPADKRVSLASVLAYPNARWAFHHMRQLGPTAAVWRGTQAAAPWAEAPQALDGLSFDAGNGARSNLAQWQANTYTDGLLVLHRGRIAYERYGAGMQPQQAHALWSVSKSFVGLLTTWMIQEGKLEADAPLLRYVPELAGTGWADATVQQALDMRTGAAYTEQFTNPQSDIHRYLRASGLVPTAADYAGPRALNDFLTTVKKDGEHGGAFRYKSADTEVLGWVLQRVTGQRLDTLLADRVWRHLGAQEDAFYWLDSSGSNVTSIGLNATLRDLGRFGELMRGNGLLDGRRIIPAAVIAEIRKGGDRQQFVAAGPTVRSGYSYHNQWWVAHDADQSFEAKGVFGQHIHINPAAELVIVKLSSHPVPDTAFTHLQDRAAFAAIAAALRQRP